MTRSALATLAAAILAAGCATWERPGASEAQRVSDQRECTLDADRATAGNPDMTLAAYRRQKLLESCMQMRGYRLVLR